MEITVPRVEEYKEINRLAVQVHDFHVNWRPDFYLKCEELITKEDLESMINNDNIFVAKIDDNIVGYVNFIVKERNHKGFRYRKQLDIDSICVDENYRNQGIGTALMNYIKQYALDNNCTDIFLNVNEENVNAINLYKKLGMQIRHIAYDMQIK